MEASLLNLHLEDSIKTSKQVSRISLYFSRSVSVRGGLRRADEWPGVRLPEQQPRHRERGGEACKASPTKI